MPAPLRHNREKAGIEGLHETSIDWSEGETVEFDYVVIGSGSAGSPVAARLVEAFPDASVLLLEAGPNNAHPMIQCAFRMFDLLNSPFDWKYKTKPMPLANKREMEWPRGKTLGGSSSINGILWVRNSKEEYDYWEKEMGMEGWGWDGVLPHFTKMETVHGPVGANRGTSGPVAVTSFTPDKVNPFSQLFVEAANALPKGEPPLSFDMPANPDYNDGEIRGAMLAQNNVYKGVRSDTYSSYIRKRGLDKGTGLIVLTNAEAQKIHLNADKSVSHVETRHTPPDGPARTFHFKARNEMVICSGAINTPILLWNSGIGGKAELEAAGIECLVDLPDVGKNLMDHLYVSLYFLTKPPKDGERGPITNKRIEEGLKIWDETGGAEGELTVGPTEAVAWFDSGLEQDGDKRADCEIEFSPIFWDQADKEGICFISEVVGVRSKGEMKLIKGKDGKPEVEIHPEYFTVDRDLRALVRALQAARRIAATEPLANRILKEHIDEEIAAKHDPFKEEEKYLEELARKYCTTVYHPACTAAMGKVVDSRLKVKGVKGLRIADASVMPRIVAGNTNAPSIMIGEKCAAMIIEDNK